MRMLMCFVLAGILSGCAFGYKEIVGVINGRTIYTSDLEELLHLDSKQVQEASVEQKRVWFESIVKIISLEDEAKRSKMDTKNLMRFFAVVDQIEVSETERASFFEKFPDLKTRPQSEINTAIKLERRQKVEAKYKQEVLDKTAREFMADNPKRSKVQNFWNKLAF